ncbi:unnamed protein product [Mytilus coruscus]|uniref:Integrase catalytic domain-containing protein n=1 Tax=Mytilus coruscus TaxID=42192 RepID=A0A6J8C9C4_MYTCO|nr:unnamed protein product [Mytilus coruscus]
MDRVALDVIGPLPKTKRGNRFILVIGDHFTRWMKAFPLPDQQAEQVAEKLVQEFISRFGTPLEIHTDQGRNFESIIFKEICKLFEIKKTRSTSYRPCSNGVIEKFNATLEKMIQNFVNKNVNDWDVYIGILMSAYRSMIHPATGFTPNMMMLGREVILPNHIIFPFPEQSMFTNNNYVEKLQSQLEDIYHLAREYLRASAQRQKKDYDTRVSQNQATNLKAFERHIATFRPHHLLETENSKNQDHLQIEGECYNVTWGNCNCDLTLKKEKYLYPEPTTVPVLLEVNEDYTVYKKLLLDPLQLKQMTTMRTLRD